MITISEHTFEEKIIDKNGWILDLGCIDFSFAKNIKQYCNNILCVDPNHNITDVPEGIFYERQAVTHLEDINEQTFYIYNDKQGYSLLNPQRDWCILERTVTVPVTTIKKLMQKYNISKFELIKFDIEGAEYKILEELDWSLSKQYSVEFHDFRFMNPYYPDNEIYYTNLFKEMLQHCDIVKHEITDHPGFPFGQGKNYWDSLFISKYV